jgi:phage gp29-like protein
VLRSAYKNWRLKDRLLRIQAEAAERNGMGIPVYKAAGPGEAEILAGEEIAAGARAGENTGLSLPQGADFELVGVSGNVPDILAAIRYHDEQIARSMLANVLNLGQARGTGSWALGTTLYDVLALSIEAIAENVRDTATKHVIEDLVDVNYGPDEPAPRLVFDEIGSKNDAIIAAIATLVDAGVLKPDEDLETFIRTTLGLPARGGAPLPAVPKTTFKEDVPDGTDPAAEEAP